KKINKWLRKHFRTERGRPKLLVLIGPSGTGKTSFALSLPGIVNHCVGHFNPEEWDNRADYIVIDDVPWEEFKDHGYPRKKNLLTGQHFTTVCEHEYFVKPPEESDDDSDDDTSDTLDDLPLFKKAEIDFLRRQRQAKSVTVDESESSPTSQDEDVETLSTTNSDEDDGTISMTEQDEEKIQNTRGKSIEYPHPYLD
ncbi:unnamed protein product, partial [Rotaria sp. Silwood1]